MSNAVRMPSAFIPHGAGPCFFMDWDPPDAWSGLAAYLRSLPATLPQCPRAILLVSAHWQGPDFAVGSGAYPELIYDYSNFPPHTYKLRYPAPGDPALAAQVAGLLRNAGLPTHEDSKRGFDHGVFIPLKLMFPEAAIPVVTLSLCQTADAATHLAAGRALSSLRDENVFILGSGMSFHNMSGFRNPAYQPISAVFDAWLTTSVELADPAARSAALANWMNAPNAKDSHPSGGEEHFLPLLVAAGAGQNDHGICNYKENIGGFRISGFRFG